MRVYEAIVKALENLGVDAAFGGAGENAAGCHAGAQAFQQDQGGDRAPRAGRRLHGLRLRHLYRNLGVCFATAGPGAFNLFSGLAVAMSDSYPVLGSPDIRASMEGQRRLERDLGREPHAGLPSHVRRHHQALVFPR